MERTVVFLIYISLIAISITSNASDEFSWKEVDRQERNFVKALYAGDYNSVRALLTDIDGSNDAVKLFNFGLIHDITFLLEYCHDCGICDNIRYCKNTNDGTLIGLTEKNVFNRSIASKFYHKAELLGHPYAGFMKRRSNLVSGYPTLTRRQVIVIENNLREQAKHDAVSKFMYHYLRLDFSLREDSKDWLIKKNTEYIKQTLEALESEAMEGRVMAMFYLGILHRLQQHHTNAFAWFYLTDKLNFMQSGWYAQDSLSRLTSTSDKEAAVKYLKKTISRIDQAKLTN